MSPREMVEIEARQSGVRVWRCENCNRWTAYSIWLGCQCHCHDELLREIAARQHKAIQHLLAIANHTHGIGSCLGCVDAGEVMREYDEIIDKASEER